MKSYKANHKKKQREREEWEGEGERDGEGEAAVWVAEIQLVPPAPLDTPFIFPSWGLLTTSPLSHAQIREERGIHV